MVPRGIEEDVVQLALRASVRAEALSGKPSWQRVAACLRLGRVTRAARLLEALPADAEPYRSVLGGLVAAKLGQDSEAREVLATLEFRNALGRRSSVAYDLEQLVDELRSELAR